jgi:hypothetical protein
VTQSYQHLLLSALTEINEFNSSKPVYGVSIVSAVVALIVCALMLIIFVYNFLFNFGIKALKSKGTIIFQYVYDDIKDDKWARIHPVMLLLRRFALVIIVVQLGNESIDTKFTMFGAVHLAYMIIFAMIRPYKLSFLNFFEIFTDISILFFLVMLKMRNKMEDWSETSKASYLLLMTASVLFTVLGLFCEFIFYNKYSLYNIHLHQIQKVLQ